MPEEFNFFPNQRLRSLIDVFHQQFRERYHVELVGGADEPVYLPGNPKERHQIIFTRDYFSSALHEIAHWCIAGEKRRRLVDYGYWYAPDGRSDDQQSQFESVEVKPQALERIFSLASKQRFRVSADNLVSNEGPSEAFKNAIHTQTLNYCQHGLPERACILTRSLAESFSVKRPLYTLNFRREDLE